MRPRLSTTVLSAPSRAAPGRRRAEFQSVLRLFAIFALTATTVAQQGTKDLSNASLEELGNIQVFSASKHMQSASDAPSSVTVVTADEIQKYGYRSLADILRAVPGFYITSDRDYSYVGVRGFGRLGDWNNRILLMIDGHRTNNIMFDQAMIGTEFPLDVDLIDRVEIVRGPSSSLYGADAFFAVINVITRKAPQFGGAELAFEPASFGTYQGRATYAGRPQGVGVLLSYTTLSSEGQNFFFPEFDSPATNNGIARGDDGLQSTQAFASIDYHGLTVEGLFDLHDKHVPTAPFGSAFNDPRFRGINNEQYVDVGYQHSLAGWQISGRTSFDQYRLTAPDPTAEVSGGPVFVNVFSARGNWWTGEVKASRTVLEKHRLTLGSEVRDNLREEQSDHFSATNSFLQTIQRSSIWAVYAQDEFAISEKLTLNAGGRYDHYQSFGGTTNPRVGLIYRPLAHSTFKLLYGTAFRAPNVNETNPGVTGYYENNLNLSPETIRTFEGVAGQGLGEHFLLSASVFQNRVKNLISVAPDFATGLLVHINSGGANATGTEIELTGKWSNGLQGAASYSFVATEAVGTSHQQLTNSPRNLAGLNLIAPLGGKRLFASLEGQYIDQRTTLAGHSLGSFQVFNFTLLAHALGKHADFSGSVYNLLNKRYSDPGRPEDPEDAIQQDGRSFRIKITARS